MLLIEQENLLNAQCCITPGEVAKPHSLDDRRMADVDYLTQQKAEVNNQLIDSTNKINTYTANVTACKAKMIALIDSGEIAIHYDTKGKDAYQNIVKAVYSSLSEKRRKESLEAALLRIDSELNIARNALLKCKFNQCQNPVNQVRVAPCGHRALCLEHANKLKTEGGICPQCRERIVSVVAREYQ